MKINSEHTQFNFRQRGILLIIALALVIIVAFFSGYWMGKAHERELWMKIENSRKPGAH